MRLAILLGLLLVTGQTLGQISQLKFSDHRTKIFIGKKHWPKWLRKEESDCWRDQLGKCIPVDPSLNFAGKYFVTGHSCGTGCRYFTITDLSTGRDLDRVLSRFTTAEPPPTIEGRPYLVDLVFHPNSKLIVAQYFFSDSVNNECRERRFLFTGRTLKALTKFRKTCQSS